MKVSSITLAGAISLAMLGVAMAGTVSQKGIDNNNTANASPLAYERSFSPTSGSAAGMGRNGTFGQDQSDFVKQEAPYGQWLTDEWSGCGGDGNCGAN